MKKSKVGAALMMVEDGTIPRSLPGGASPRPQVESSGFRSPMADDCFGDGDPPRCRALRLEEFVPKNVRDRANSGPPKFIVAVQKNQPSPRMGARELCRLESGVPRSLTLWPQWLPKPATRVSCPSGDSRFAGCGPPQCLAAESEEGTPSPWPSPPPTRRAAARQARWGRGNRTATAKREWSIQGCGSWWRG